MFKGTLGRDGRPGPIEERYGRRLLRLVDPESEEGRKLLTEGDVDLVGPDGEHLGCISIIEAYEELTARLESRLDAIRDGADQTDFEAALKLLRSRAEKIVSDPE
jgi:hypothetical protein